MKRAMKKTIAIILVLTMVLALAVGCSKAPTGGTSTAGVPISPGLKDNVKRLGFSVAYTTAEAILLMTQNIEARYKDYGFDELIVLNAENSLERQIDQMQDLAAQNCDIIMIETVDPDGIVPVVEELAGKGFPIVAIDRRINSDAVYYTACADNVQLGRDMVQGFALLTLPLSKGDGSIEVLKMVGNLASVAVSDRLKGFDEEMGYWSHLKVVGEPSYENSTEKCYNGVIDSFKTNPNIRCIMVTGDNYVAPVVSALKEIGKFYPAGHPDHVFIASVDGTKTSLESLMAGENDIVMNTNFYDYVTYALEACQNYMNGNYSVGGRRIIYGQLTTSANVQKLQDEGYLWTKPVLK